MLPLDGIRVPELARALAPRQEDGDRSVIGWGTYDWAFRLEEGTWKVTRLAIRILGHDAVRAAAVTERDGNGQGG